MKRSGLASRFSAYSVVLLSVFLCASLASGQLVVNPSGLSFGSVPTGGRANQSVILSNSGGSSLTVSQAAVTGPGFTLSAPALPLLLFAGKSVSLGITFTPVTSGTAMGSLGVSWAPVLRGSKKRSASTATVSVALAATGDTTPIPATANVTPAAGQLVANPGSLSFGSVQVGNMQTLSAAITNAGGSSVTLSQATAAGAGFSITGLSLPMTLAVGQSVTFNASFTPLSGGSASGSVTVNSDAANGTMMLGLAGMGMAQGQLAVTPVSTDFGSVMVGTSKSQAGTLTATGGSVLVSAASMTSAEFSISGIALPVTIGAGQSVPFTLSFSPQASGTAAGTGAFVSNASNPVSANLSGTGVAPAPHNVDLAWSSVSAIVGYNVYRGSQPAGPFTKINTALDASTIYTDSDVQAGQTYYYVTTAVDASGAESRYSGAAQASVPTP